jgi:N-acetylmuramoyl-L-alanine amidase
MGRWGRIGLIALALAAGALAPVVAQSVPSPTPKPALAAGQAAGAVAPAAAAAQTGRDPIADIISRQSMPVVLSTRLGEGASKTRLVIEVSDPVQLQVFTLSNPYRVVIDMPEVLWNIAADARPSGRGVVQSYRYGLFRKGNSRFVLDLNGPVKVGTPQVFPPEGAYAFRIVVDLTPTTESQYVASAGWPKPNAPSAGTQVANLPPSAGAPPSVPAAPRGKRMVVIDPGHGGIDPGTHGATGLQEKAIVLAVGRYLRAALEQTGRYRVTLTRETDVFVPLRERVVISRAAKGELFVSLHVDSNEHHEVRGASIYTLSEKGSDQAAARLAERENMSDVIAGIDLSHEESQVASILIDLAQRDTINRSIRFSRTVLDALPAATMVRPLSPMKSAAFAVLKGPDIPAVLIELGYLSNAQDEAQMATDAWRRRVAKAIAAAIDRHFNREAPIAEQRAAMP